MFAVNKYIKTNETKSRFKPYKWYNTTCWNDKTQIFIRVLYEVNLKFRFNFILILFSLGLSALLKNFTKVYQFKANESSMIIFNLNCCSKSFLFLNFAVHVINFVLKFKEFIFQWTLCSIYLSNTILQIVFSAFFLFMCFKDSLESRIFSLQYNCHYLIVHHCH